jgi:hypothetical protein
MERITIPIKKVSSGFSSRALMAAVGSALTFGMLGGIFLGNIVTLPVPGNLRGVLGATGAATPQEEARAEGTLVAQTPSDNTLPTATPAPETASTPTTTNNPAIIAQRAELESSITEKNIRIEKNIEEIKRIKDESVLLITQFEQNCGNWDDACAITYRETLERNNTAYEELLFTQRALYKELADAERALIATE